MKTAFWLGNPPPDIYLRAAKNLNLLPSVCVVIEDSFMGITAAREAKIGKIIALGPEGKHQKLKQAEGVSKVISNLGEIKIKEIFE